MRIIAAFLILLLPFSFVACGRQENTSCREILHAMTEAEIGLPSGKIYSLSAPRGDGEYLSEHLINSLYGDGSAPVMVDGWLDLALFLPSSAHPCEMAVFLCNSRDTANDTARMLCRRLDTLRISKCGGKFDYYLDNATVTITRNYVLFLVSSDVGNTLKIASKIIR